MEKLNNKGMTLIEILAAIIILSIVSIVFLRSFVTAFQMNEQAKEKQYSLTLAQSLMESVKAYDLVALDNQFSGPDSSFRVYDLGTDGSKTFAMTGTESRSYSLSGIVYQKDKFNDKYKYDVEIQVSPAAGAPYHAHLVKAQSINPYNDAIYLEEADEQRALRDAIAAGLTSNGHTGSVSVLNSSKVSAARTVKVEITADDVVTIVSTYDYTVNDYPITKADGTNATVSFSGSVDSTSSPVPCYDKALIGESSVTLQNLYMYYYPAYKDSANGLIKCTSDKIEIQNSSTTLQNIYLLKQENPALSTTQVNTLESSYQPEVSCVSPADLNLIHNLRETLHTGSVVYPSLSGRLVDQGTPWDDDTAETTLLYDVKVIVRKHGGTEPVCELVGSTNAK